MLRPTCGAFGGKVCMHATRTDRLVGWKPLVQTYFSCCSLAPWRRNSLSNLPHAHTHTRTRTHAHTSLGRTAAAAVHHWCAAVTPSCGSYLSQTQAHSLRPAAVQTSSEADRALYGYKAQCGLLSEHLETLIEGCEARMQSLICEGQCVSTAPWLQSRLLCLCERTDKPLAVGPAAAYVAAPSVATSDMPS